MLFRSAAGRVEDALKTLSKCKSVRRTNIDSELAAVSLTVRWAGFVEDIVRDVFERSDSKVTETDTTIESLELNGNIISVQVWKKR